MTQIGHGLSDTARMPATDWREQIPEHEQARFERYATMFGDMQQKRAHGGVVARALHAKANLGAEAELEVLADVPADAKLGLFAQPATYRGFVRYSNGSPRRQADGKPDVRGFAVKLLGVPGKKVIPGMEDATTQDFLAIRTPSVPMRDADEFVTLVRAAQSPVLAPFKVIGALGFGRGIRLLKSVLAGFKMPTAPLAATTYYSALPIKYGPCAVHFAFVAVDPPSVSAGKTPDALGDELAARLRDRAVVYDLRVQFFQDETRTPIEDASVEWKVDDAPFISVARLTLPAQDVTSARGRKVSAFVEQLAFDPWHAREDLRPLGNIMRARNYAYRVSTKNRAASAEPTVLPSFE
jgi:catalase